MLSDEFYFAHNMMPATVYKATLIDGAYRITGAMLTMADPACVYSVEDAEKYMTTGVWITKEENE